MGFFVSTRVWFTKGWVSKKVRLWRRLNISLFSKATYQQKSLSIVKPHLSLMRLSIFAIFFLFLLSTLSCKKDTDRIKNETINISLRANEAYEYDLGLFGDEEGARIKQQATNFAISEMKRLEAVRMVYYYKPKLNFTGLDEVTLKSEWGSDGVSKSTRFLHTTIKFVIKE